MTKVPMDHQIQATDARGRVRVTSERRTELLNEFDRSGMTMRRFAEWSGVNYQTLMGWIARRRKVAKLAVRVEPEPTAAGWVEAIVDSRSSKTGSAGLIIRFPGEAQMEIFDTRTAALAAEVLRHWANGTVRTC